MIALFILIGFIVLGCRHVDAQTVQAARTLGMNRRAILWHIILPQARKWIVVGVVLALAVLCAEGWIWFQYGGMLLEYARGTHS